ncbi:MAG: GDSL-type esterase/lipase family protein [Prosthecobacter sp.]|uniref:GDSL-type esterase/lipase family protein n=1 Tax=Prosthecobacter sp. TaxID=1965333 RepID=UPI003900F265
MTDSIIPNMKRFPETLVAFLLALLACLHAETVTPKAGKLESENIIAVYGDASIAPTPPPGWSFHWNARGNLGDSAGYAPLSYDEKARAYGVRDASGALRTDAPGHTISRGIGYLDVSAMRDKDGVARCYVASYKLSADSVGEVWINHGNLRTPLSYGTDLRVYVNDQLKAQSLIKRDRFAQVFQFYLGRLKKEDVIHVAVGPSENSPKAAGRLFYIIEDCQAGQKPAKPVNIISPALHASAPQFGADGKIGTAYADKHKAQCAAVVATRPDLVFIGDSITARWPQEVLEARFGKHRPINLGIGGDWIQNVLWRVQNGTLDKAAPKVVVLLIGTNNLTGKFTPDELTADLGALLKAIQSKTPRSKILLLGILPRGASIKDEINESIRQTNAKLATLANNEQVFYLDIGDKLVEPDGTISPAVMPDKLHVAGPGYTRWMEAMGPTLDKLLNERP